MVHHCHRYFSIHLSGTFFYLGLTEDEIVEVDEEKAGEISTKDVQNADVIQEVKDEEEKKIHDEREAEVSKLDEGE